MLSGRRFLLRTATIGVDASREKRVAVTIPAGVTIEVVSGPRPNDPMVNVLSQGKTLMMFVQDLQERGEEVSRRRSRR